MTKHVREITAWIAQQFNLSPYTVKSHIHNILEKMALHSRLEIAIHAYDKKER